MQFGQLKRRQVITLFGAADEQSGSGFRRRDHELAQQN
jgi:hypothetical protein